MRTAFHQAEKAKFGHMGAYGLKRPDSAPSAILPSPKTIKTQSYLMLCIMLCKHGQYVFSTLARRKGNKTKLLWMRGIENTLEIMSFGVMEMPVQGSNPWCLKGNFLGQQLRATPPVEHSYHPGRAIASGLVKITKLPNLDSGAQAIGVHWLKISAKVLCEKISVKKLIVFQDFQE